MNLTISGHHLEVTPALREYVLTKLERVTRHFDQVVDVNVLLSVEKLKEKERRQKAEVTLHVKGRDIFVEQSNEDLYAAIDQLMDKLDRQVVRHKDRTQDHHHRQRRSGWTWARPEGDGWPCRGWRGGPFGASVAGALPQPLLQRSRLEGLIPQLRGRWAAQPGVVAFYNSSFCNLPRSACRPPAGATGRSPVMNRLAAILPPSNVLVDVDATSKKRVFEQAGLLFENQHAIARGTVTDNLFARERLGSTGLGHGVAIPHGRIKGLKNPLAAVLRTQQPIGFDSPDDEPVKLLIFLLVPEAATQRHLEILSEIAEMLSDRELRERLMSEPDATAVHKLIADWQAQKSAA